MTCIVGLVDGKDVWLGADSCGGEGNSRQRYKTSKLVAIHGPNGLNRSILVGYTSSYRMGNLLAQSAKAECHEVATPDAWLIDSFVPMLRRLFGKEGFLAKKDEREEGGEMLVALAARLFVVQSDFSVLEPLDGYTAIGSGADVALGALYANRGSPAIRVQKAVAAAAHHTPMVDWPWHIWCLTGDNLIAERIVRDEPEFAL